jgi:hypothetical protein
LKFHLANYPEKTADLSQVTDKLYLIMLYQVHLAMNGVRGIFLEGVKKKTLSKSSNIFLEVIFFFQWQESVVVAVIVW